MNRSNALFKSVTILVVFFFIATSARAEGVFPAVGQMVSVSPAFLPPLLTGVTVNLHNPLKLSFLLDIGQAAHVQSYCEAGVQTRCDQLREVL